jgi:hypothetical protein
MTLQVVLYLLAILTSGACTLLLVREYLARRMRLLLWSALCFVGLTLNNILIFVDLVMFPAIDLRLARLAAALIGMMLLLYGFIWETDTRGR